MMEAWKNWVAAMASAELRKETIDQVAAKVSAHRGTILKWNVISLLTMMVIFTAEPALAVTETMPWEGPLQTVMNSLCGPVASAAAVIAFVVTGLLVAFGEMSGLFGVMMRVAFGLSLALFAVNFLDFFGVSGFVCDR